MVVRGGSKHPFCRLVLVKWNQIDPPPSCGAHSLTPCIRARGVRLFGCAVIASLVPSPPCGTNRSDGRHFGGSKRTHCEPSLFLIAATQTAPDQGYDRAQQVTVTGMLTIWLKLIKALQAPAKA